MGLRAEEKISYGSRDSRLNFGPSRDKCGFNPPGSLAMSMFLSVSPDLTASLVVVLLEVGLGAVMVFASEITGRSLVSVARRCVLKRRTLRKLTQGCDRGPREPGGL